MASPAFRSFSEQQAANPTLNKPAGAVAGDLLIAVITGGSVAAVTPPAGWTAVHASTPLFTFYKRIGAGEPATYAFDTGGSNADAAMLAYVYAELDTSSAVTGPHGGSNPPLAAMTTTVAETTVLGVIVADTFDLTYLPPTGFTERFDLGAPARLAFEAADIAQLVAGSTGTPTWSSPSGASHWTAGIAVRKGNTAPNAPTLVTPVAGATIDRATDQVFDWDFNDPDPGDSQSKYDFRYRLVGAPSWTETLDVASTSTMRTVTGGTFAAGNYEWQIRTYDARGYQGPWSASEFFTAGNAPSAPTITAPVNGATISTELYTFQWSAPEQDAYQLRRVADNGAGVANTAVVYQDTGTVVSTIARHLDVELTENNRTEHVQLRRRVSGLWSPWVSHRYDVDFTAPAEAAADVVEDVPSGAVTVQAVHPAPVGDQPPVIAVDVYRRREGDGGDGIRVVADLPPAAVFTDWAVRSGISYEYRVRAIGDNGTTSWSQWYAGDELRTEDGDILTTETGDMLVLEAV